MPIKKSIFDEETILNLWDQGKTQKTIAKTLNLSPSTVSRFIVSRGLSRIVNTHKLKNGKKYCGSCKLYKELEDFYTDNQRISTISTYCSECLKRKSITYRRRKQQENPEQWALYERNKYLKQKYNITLDQYNQMLEKQNGVCICGNDEKRKDKNGINLPLSVDHDHSCCGSEKSCGKCIRALLCNKCNATIGFAEDSPSKLRLLANYLEKYQGVE